MESPDARIVRYESEDDVSVRRDENHIAAVELKIEYV